MARRGPNYWEAFEYTPPVRDQRRILRDAVQDKERIIGHELIVIANAQHRLMSIDPRSGSQYETGKWYGPRGIQDLNERINDAQALIQKCREDIARMNAELQQLR
jgi:hypothetical protein